ncbi:MAG: TonB-dependent receptor plug domain-containing protein, partial [Bacteroidota bacterium]
EVLFGPGSVIYGSDAIGGVMNFYTLKPAFAVNGGALVKGSAILRYASASNEKTGHFDVNIGLKKWAFVSSATYTEYGDLKMGSDGPDEYLRYEYVERINGVDSVIKNDDPQVQVPTGYNQVNLMQKIRFMPNDNWDFNYGIHYSTTSDYPRYDRLIRYRNGKPRSAEWYYGPQEWMMNNLSLMGTAATGIYDKFGITVAHQFFKESRHDRDFGKKTLVNRTEKVNVVSANMDFEKRLSENQRLFYGLESLLNKVHSEGTDEDIITGETVNAASRYPDGSTWNSYAAYLSYSNEITGQLTFQGGLRYNLVSLQAEFDTTFYPFPFTQADLFKGAITGSAGLTYQSVNDWLFNLNLSSGFRAPNIDDVGKVFDSEPGSVIVPNPDLKPEYAYNGEFGITKRFNDAVEVDVSVFYTLLDDAMVRRDYSLNGLDSIIVDGELSRVQAVQNAAQAWVYGIQADMEADLPAGFGIRGQFNWQHGEEELNNGSTAPLRHAAPMFGMLHITYSRSKFKADFYGLINGEISYADLAPSERDKAYIYAIDSEGNPHSPSWYTINLKLMYQLTGYLMINAGVENITDQRYRPYSSGIAGPGRNFMASVKVNF